MMKLLTNRLIIRPFHAGDLEAMRLVLGDQEVMRFSDHGAMDDAAVWQWLDRQAHNDQTDPGFGRWAVSLPNSPAAIGYIGLTQDSARMRQADAELGFRLARQHWGCGYATEAGKAMIDYAFANTDVKRIIAIVDPENLSSIRVLDKLGMSFAGTVMLAGYDHPDHLFLLDRLNS